MARRQPLPARHLLGRRRRAPDADEVADRGLHPRRDAARLGAGDDDQVAQRARRRALDLGRRVARSPALRAHSGAVRGGAGRVLGDADRLPARRQGRHAARTVPHAPPPLPRGGEGGGRRWPLAAPMGALRRGLARGDAGVEVLPLPGADPGRLLSVGEARFTMARVARALGAARGHRLAALGLRELVAVFAQHLGVCEELHHRPADGARLALLHGEHLPQPHRVRARRHAALVLRRLRRGQAGAAHFRVRAGRALPRALAAAPGAQAGAELARGVVPRSHSVGVQVGALLRQRAAGVPPPRRLLRRAAPREAARACPALGSRGRGGAAPSGQRGAGGDPTRTALQAVRFSSGRR